jgi:hypothetical protein
MMPHTLPCITVGEAIAALQKLPADAKLYAWAPGSYMPVACVVGSVHPGRRVLLEINVPQDAALARP